MTYENKFVQGAVTSPSLSNLVFRQFDIRIESYCAKLGVKYSRYADDLLFSSSSDCVHKKWFRSSISRIIRDGNFHLNYKKTKLQTGELHLNGYVVNDSVHLSRKKLSSISKLLWDMEHPDFQFKNHFIKGTLNYLAGYRSFLIQSSRYTTDPKQKSHLEKLIHRIEKQIEKSRSKI